MSDSNETYHADQKSRCSSSRAAETELILKNAELAAANEALQVEIAKRQQAEQALQQERLLLRTLIDNLPDAIYAKDFEGRKILVNPSDVRNTGRKTAEEVLGKTDFELFPHHLAEHYIADDRTVLDTGQPILWREEHLPDDHGEKRWLLTSKVPMRSPEGKVIGLVGIGRDITRLKVAEKKLEAIHRDLMQASRQAGMAEIATNVLHNVGNVLNSVNTSAGVILERLQSLKLDRVLKLAKLLRENQHDLASFFAPGGRGEKSVEFMEALAENLQQERSGLRDEAKELIRKVDHIKQIVAMQQNYAHVAGLVEEVSLADLVEDALRLHSGAYARHGITVIREFGQVPLLRIDRHKVLQIMVNLLSNAKHACDAGPPQVEKRVTLRIEPAPENCVRFIVLDNGVGILPENLTRIFGQGFTTRKDGHGFGLHASALAAKELGGKLTVHSDGPGRGASFSLALPLANPNEGKVPAPDQGVDSSKLIK